MLKGLSRQLSQWRRKASHLLSDDTGTAGLLTSVRTIAPKSWEPWQRIVTRTPHRLTVRQASTILPPTPVIRAEGNSTREYQTVKRALDIVGAAALLIVLSPILLVVLAILAVTTRGKPLFYQERVGLCGRRFRMYKFRTMRLDADKFQHLVKNEKDGPIFKSKFDPRVTRLGRWLRKTSIDEMPQLFSVLLGDMSLVGPRPPVPKEVAQYKPWQRRRLAVKPGLTCLWQISGRSDIGFEDWVRMDIWYLRNQTLWTDIKLLVRTPLKVITCKGAY
jgi:lipopolysaccharide/colanic/teichoic acid biosynthesis glycosyltransferase